MGEASVERRETEDGSPKTEDERRETGDRSPNIDVGN